MLLSTDRSLRGPRYQAAAASVARSTDSTRTQQAFARLPRTVVLSKDNLLHAATALAYARPFRPERRARVP